MGCVIGMGKLGIYIYIYIYIYICIYIYTYIHLYKKEPLYILFIFG